MSDETAIESVITAAFSSYRSEWMQDLHSYYTEPKYFPELVTPRPCFLIGGRGTGKTTALKSMAYSFQKETISNKIDRNYFGIYHKFEIGLANSFSGKDISSETWTILFSHYLNLRICLMTLDLLKDLVNDNIIRDEEVDLNPMMVSLGLSPVDSITSAFASLRMEISSFSRAINNPNKIQEINTSILNIPIGELFSSISESQSLSKKFIYLIFDEFENLHSWQQKIFNTLVKHCGGNFVYKVGAKKNGLKTKYTLADDEPLFSPQDYAKIDIDERVSTSEFSEFAGNVCNIRLRRIQEGSGAIRCPEINIKLLLERLDMEAEAIKLGIKERNKSINESISRLTSLVNIDKIHQLTELQKFYIYYLVEKNQTSLEREIRAYLEKDSNWFTNFENYKFDLLFKIRTGKVGVVKYYCGWETYVGLSGNNIRFILMLLESTLLTAVKDNRGSLPFKIDAETQTKSCKDVAQSVFDEIAGLSYDGPQYQQIVVGFGKIFSFYARNIVKKSPELNQFNISDISLHKETEEFVRRCVMHYVLLESKETKQTRRDEISEYDYSLHPIFSPKFNYSNRRGRKFSINSETFERIKQNPEYGVKSILKESARADERGGLFD